ncbi:hypothetical protein D1839_12945 [Roseburia sp. 1XD42-34]|nr:hypothetical protein [Roseburia sp. 1XD42-34]RKI76372.1 hypothetical protein D7V87_13570 [Clostridium sp. 1xD42-85]
MVGNIRDNWRGEAKYLYFKLLVVKMSDLETTLCLKGSLKKYTDRKSPVAVGFCIIVYFHQMGSAIFLQALTFLAQDYRE